MSQYLEGRGGISCGDDGCGLREGMMTFLARVEETDLSTWGIHHLALVAFRHKLRSFGTGTSHAVIFKRDNEDQ
jgi:hypothetical protein